MKPKKSTTLAAAIRGEGSKKERSEFARQMARAIPLSGEYVGDALAGAAALAAVGVAFDPDEDFATLVRRADDHPAAAPVVALIRRLNALRERDRRRDEARRKVASESARQSRSRKATTAAVRKYVEDFVAKNGTKRGAVTKGALEFNIDQRTFSKLLCT